MEKSMGATARLRALIASLLVFAMLVPFTAGCGRSDSSSSMGNASSMERPQEYGTVAAPQNAPQQHKGLSTGQKVAILAGTAALIYLYNKHKNAQGTGAQGQYYRSKNGQIYYRDQQGNAHWVTPPANGIQVPADEAAQYQRAAQTGQWDVSSVPGPAGAY